MPVIAEVGPFPTSVVAPPTSEIPYSTTPFVVRHQEFIDQVTILNHCFRRGEITGFGQEELEDHIVVALQDNYIIENEDTGIFCTGQVAWRLKELTKGYVYERL
jgi:hypothetical protein